MTAARVLPTFLVIGAPRAATTALHHWLGQHPEVCASRPKETQFFSLHYERGADYYSTFFAHYAGEAAIGESTPMYLALPYVAPRIADLLPDVALVAVLREPVRQTLSSYAKLRALGVERRSFDEALRAELARPLPDEDQAEQEWQALSAAADAGHSCTQTPYLLAGRYVDALQRYRHRFSAEQLTVLLHDDLRSNPDAFLARLAGAIGIDPSLGSASLPYVNESVGARSAWIRRHRRLIPSARLRTTLVGIAARGETSQPAADPGLLRELDAYFHEANRGLSQLLGREVEAWRPLTTA